MSRRFLLFTVLIILFIIPAMSCTGETSAEVAESDLPRETPSDVSQSNLNEAVHGNTSFAFDLYNALKNSEDNDGVNLFFSPYSVSMALAMTYAGARGETESQMADTLNFTLSQDRLHPTLNALDTQLMSRELESADGDIIFSISNSIWGQTGYHFLQEFLDLLATSYGAGLRLCDFGADPGGCREIINTWVEDQTRDRILDLIPLGAINTLTTLVLVNAIYFKGDWLYPFEEDRTTEMPFHLLDGSLVNVQMMQDTHEVSYADGDGWQALELPYVGEKLSMLLILPDGVTFNEFENSLDDDLLSEIVDNLMHPSDVIIYLPRFTFTFGTSLVEYLKDMGMPAAFFNADFSGMDGTRILYISDVIHKAFIAVDEIGSEAAAATAVIMERGMPMLQIFKADRPFIFMIRDNETGSILFIGRVLNPEE